MSRLTRFKSEMTKRGYDAAVISSQINIRYLTDFDYTDGYVLVTKNKSYVLADFRYIEAARATVNPADFEIIMPTGGMLATVASLLDENEVKVVAYEDYTLACADLERMKKIFVEKELVPGASEMADGLRLYKDAGEIEKMKKAQVITDAAFAHILKVLTPDMTDLQNSDNWSELMVRAEELKTMPFGDVWAEYCKECGAPQDGEWFNTVKNYEREVLAKRG